MSTKERELFRKQLNKRKYLSNIKRENVQKRKRKGWNAHEHTKNNVRTIIYAR